METLLRKYTQYFAYGVLAISVILMAYVVYEITNAKQQFATELITKSVAQTESELDNFFNRITHLVHAVEQQYETGFWEGQSLEKSVLHSISLIDNYAPISSVGIADRRGYELNIIPDTAAGRWLTRQVFVDRWGYVEKWRRWKRDDSLVETARWEDTLAVDPRERPWFKGAVDAGGRLFWTEPYAYTTGPEVGITASLLLQNERETVDGLPSAGIIAFDLTLGDLNTFVSDLELTRNQNIFLLTGDNRDVIALHNYTPDLGPEGLKSAMLVSPERLGNQMLLEVLDEADSRRAFSFETGGNTWWGILRPYEITESRTVNIVSILPEEDFALEINRTLWVGIGSFLLIIILSLLVVWNHNKLHRISNIFSEKNKLISDQKRVLLSEVHHRVKNNLALISAFMELDLMHAEDSPTGDRLRRNWRRIKVIAIVQEEGYKSEVLGSLPAGNLVSGIAGHLNGTAAETGIDVRSDEIDININKALTYGLLVHELLLGLLGQNGALSIEIDITRDGDRMRTSIRADAAGREEPALKWPDSDVCDAFVQQLEATVEKSAENGCVCIIEFELKEQKGIVSSKSYRAME